MTADQLVRELFVNHWLMTTNLFPADRCCLCMDDRSNNVVAPVVALHGDAMGCSKGEMMTEEEKPFNAEKELRAMTEETQKDVAAAMGHPNMLNDLAEMKAKLPVIAAYHEYLAMRYITKYKALKAAGFDEKQALFLCCQPDA